MRSRIVPLIGLALMIGGVAVAWESGTREAQYKGRPASAWVAQLSSTTVADRVAAAEALGHITPGQAIEPLRNALADDSPLVSGNAALALSRYGAAGVPSLAAMLQHHRPSVRRTAAQGLGFAGKSAIHFLSQLVALLDDPDSSTRIETARALARIGAPAVPAVVGALESASTRARAAAALALCEMGPVAGPASESLAVALRDADSLVNQAAAEALAHIGPAALPQLVAALDDPAPPVRHRAANALSRFGSEAKMAINPLVARLEDPESPVRRAAADALGRIGAGPAAGPLQARLRDAVADVRQAAAEALGRLGRAAVPAVPLLLELQGDAAEAVRRAATDALVKIVTGTSHDAG